MHFATGPRTLADVSKFSNGIFLTDLAVASPFRSRSASLWLSTQNIMLCRSDGTRLPLEDARLTAARFTFRFWAAFNFRLAFAVFGLYSLDHNIVRNAVTGLILRVWVHTFFYPRNRIYISGMLPIKVPASNIWEWPETCIQTTYRRHDTQGQIVRYSHSFVYTNISYKLHILLRKWIENPAAWVILHVLIVDDQPPNKQLNPRS